MDKDSSRWLPSPGLCYIDHPIKKTLVRPMIIAFILFAVFRPSSSAPLTSALEPIWRRSDSDTSDAPDVRTTLDILWGCLATMFACSWVSLHPNLPDPHISGWSQFKRRVGVVILAIFTPEFILMWALRQRTAAASIMRKYNRTVLNRECYSDGPEESSDREEKSLAARVEEWFQAQPLPNNDPSWTLTHGFYVQMGGFLLYNKDTPLRVLDFDKLLKLIQSGLVDHPSVTEEDTLDRSKGDFFTKAFAVAQTTWFIVQCAARWIMPGFAVTELEVITLAFAVLNIITYSIWWAKPQNVSMGVRVQLKEEEMVRRGFNTDGRELLDREDPIDFRHSIDGIDGQETIGLLHRDEMDGTNSNRREGQQEVDITIAHHGAEGVDIVTGSSRMDDNHGGNTSDSYPSQNERDATNSGGFFQALTAKYLTNPLRKLDLKLRDFVVGPRQEDAIELIVNSPGTLNIGTFYAYDTGGLRSLISAAASGILFGWLHLITWGFAFPTSGETVVWRVATLCIAVASVIVSPVILVGLLYFSQPQANRRGERFGGTLMLCMPQFQLVMMPLLFYIFARIAVVVLIFGALRSLRADELNEIPWNSFFPHIS